MAHKEIFFEIREIQIADELKANLVMVEDKGEGAAYLGWCESLALDTPQSLPEEGAVEQAPLMLPFADLALLTRQGSPVPAPDDWRDMVVRPLAFQDYLLLTIEEDLVLEPDTVASLA